MYISLTNNLYLSQLFGFPRKLLRTLPDSQFRQSNSVALWWRKPSTIAFARGELRISSSDCVKIFPSLISPLWSIQQGTRLPSERTPICLWRALQNISAPLLLPRGGEFLDSTKPQRIALIYKLPSPLGGREFIFIVRYIVSNENAFRRKV